MPDAITIACQSITDLFDVLKFDTDYPQSENENVPFLYTNHPDSQQNNNDSSQQLNSSQCQQTSNNDQQQSVNPNNGTEPLRLNPEWIAKAHRPEILFQLLHTYSARVLEWLTSLILNDPDHDVTRYKIGILYREINLLFLTETLSVENILENFLLEFYQQLKNKHENVLFDAVWNLRWLSLTKCKFSGSLKDFELFQINFESVERDFKPESFQKEFFKFISEVCNNYLRNKSIVKLQRSCSLPDLKHAKQHYSLKLSQLFNHSKLLKSKEKKRPHPYFTFNLNELTALQQSNNNNASTEHNYGDINNENINDTKSSHGSSSSRHIPLEPPVFFVSHYFAMLGEVHKYLLELMANGYLADENMTYIPLGNFREEFELEEEGEIELNPDEIDRYFPAQVFTDQATIFRVSKDTNRDDGDVATDVDTETVACNIDIRHSSRDVEEGNIHEKCKLSANGNKHSNKSEMISTVQTSINSVTKTSTTTIKPTAAAAQQRTNTFIKCIICLSKFKPSQFYRQLSCGHVFHKTCCDEWLKFKRDCPLCRKSMFGLEGSTEMPTTTSTTITTTTTTSSSTTTTTTSLPTATTTGVDNSDNSTAN